MEELIMIYAKIENQEEYKRLEDALKASKNKSWYRRLEIIQNSAKGIIVPKLNEIFGICQQTVRNYINAYNQGGLDKLMPDKQTGRPPKIGHWIKEDWDKVLEQTPNQYEKLKTQSRQWTLERLALYLKEYHGIEVTLQSINNSLRKTGRRTGRSKLRVGSPDPDYIVKRAGVKAVQNLHLRDN
jgi:transposase